MWNNDIGLNQIEQDWHLLSWSAKWLGDPPGKILYQDQRRKRDIQDDKQLLKKIWKLLDQADVVVTQNGKRFDVKKLNARFLLNGFKPYTPFEHVDTCEIARRKFSFTSNKLEYLTEKLCKKYKKLAEHKKFPGFRLWSECIKGNISAWKEMEKYNKYDVLSLEELYLILEPWAGTMGVNFALYADDNNQFCNCGGKLVKNGERKTKTGTYQRYLCKECRTPYRGRKNLFDKEKKKSILVRI